MNFNILCPMDWKQLHVLWYYCCVASAFDETQQCGQASVNSCPHSWTRVHPGELEGEGLRKLDSLFCIGFHFLVSSL